MDLGAYVNIDALEEYVAKHYGEVPRLRGIRFMEAEEPDENPGTRQMEVYNSYCGKPVVYVHTRCGSACWGDGDPDANYMYCGGKEFDERNSELLLDSLNDEWDGTYRDHYLKAIEDDEYKALLKRMTAKKGE